MFVKLPKIVLLVFFTWTIANSQTVPVPRHFVPDLNKRAISLVKPVFPDVALEDGADGSQLVLRVVVGTAGTPISTVCSATCHPLLKDAAVFAAMNSTFQPLMIDGRAIEYEGNVNYSYVVQRVDWARFGSALESIRQFKNISAGVVAAMLSDAFSDEKAKLVALEANGGVHRDIKQKTIYDVEVSIRSKLKGVDRWKFNTSIALRRVTFISSLVGEVDRDDLTEALVVLGKYANAAPAEVSRDLVANLLSVSEYKIPTDITDKDLKQAISELTRSIRF